MNKQTEFLKKKKNLKRKGSLSIRSPAQVGSMKQVLGPGALGRPRGIGGEGGRRGDRDGKHM